LRGKNAAGERGKEKTQRDKLKWVEEVLGEKPFERRARDLGDETSKANRKGRAFLLMMWVTIKKKGVAPGYNLCRLRQLSPKEKKKPFV